jgi:Ras-related protein Rab-2A
MTSQPVSHMLFFCLCRSYYRDASGALLVFDVTRRESFNHLSQWLEEAHQYATDQIIITLVGNKCDLTSK